MEGVKGRLLNMIGEVNSDIFQEEGMDSLLMRSIEALT